MNLQIFSFRRKAESMRERDMRFRRDIERVMLRLDVVRNQFDYVDDEDLIEALIYEENGLMSRYRYLIKYAKANNICLPAFSDNSYY